MNKVCMIGLFFTLFLGLAIAIDAEAIAAKLAKRYGRKRKGKLPFIVLRDSQAKVISSYGLQFEVKNAIESLGN